MSQPARHFQPWVPPNGRGSPGRAILRARGQMFRNRARNRPPGDRWRFALQSVVIGPILLSLLGLIWLASFVVFRALRGPEQATDGLATLFGLLILGGFVGSASAALQALYLSTDVPFLLSLPLPMSVAYGGKFADALIGTGPIALVVVAAVGGYGTARAETWWYPLVAIAVCAALLASMTSIGVLVVAGIAAVVPVERARRVLAIVSLALVVAVFAGWAAVAPRHRSSDFGPNPNGLQQSLATSGELLTWTPIGWAADTLVAAATNDGGRLLASGGLFAASAVGIAALAYIVFAASFARGVAAFRAATPVPRPRIAGPVVALLLRPLASLPGAMEPLVRKEWLAMGRDLRRLSGAIWPLGMVALYTVTLSRRETRAPADVPELGFWLGAGTLALIPWGASLGISIFAFGTERRSIHLLRTLPIRPRTLFAAKVVASLVPVLLASEAATVVVSLVRGATAGQFVAMVSLVAWATTGYVVIDTAASAVAPNFEADHVQRATGLAGRLFGFACGAAFSVASFAAAARLILFTTGTPASLVGLLGWNVNGLEPFGWPVVVLGGAVAAGSVAVAVAVGLYRVERIVRLGA